MDAFLGFLVFLVLCVLYFLPAILRVMAGEKGFFTPLMFFGACLLVNCPIIGWFMMMALAEAEQG